MASYVNRMNRMNRMNRNKTEPGTQHDSSFRDRRKMYLMNEKAGHVFEFRKFTNLNEPVPGRIMVGRNTVFRWNAKFIEISPFENLEDAKRALKRYEKGENIGFSRLASLKSMGRIRERMDNSN